MGAKNVEAKLPRADRGGARDRRAGAVGLRPDARQHRDDAVRASRRAASRTSSTELEAAVQDAPRDGQLPRRRALRADRRGRHRVHRRRPRPRRRRSRAGLPHARSIRGSTTSRPSNSRCGSRRTLARPDRPPGRAATRSASSRGTIAPLRPARGPRRSTARPTSESVAASGSRPPRSCAAPAGCGPRSVRARSTPSGWPCALRIGGSRGHSHSGSAMTRAGAGRVGPSFSTRPRRRRLECRLVRDRPRPGPGSAWASGEPGWLMRACQGPKSVSSIRPSLS